MRKGRGFIADPIDDGKSAIFKHPSEIIRCVGVERRVHVDAREHVDRLFLGDGDARTDLVVLRIISWDDHVHTIITAEHLDHNKDAIIIGLHVFAEIER